MTDYWSPTPDTGTPATPRALFARWRDPCVARKENIHGNSEANRRGGGARRQDQAGPGGSPQTQARAVARTRSRGQLPRLRSDQRHPAGPDPPEAKITSGPLKARRGLRPAAPFSHSRRNRSFFLKISGNWPIIRLESSAFTGLGKDGSKIFRYRRHPRPRQRDDYAGTGAQGRAGGGLDLSPRRASSSRAHRQGYPPLRLHDRNRAGSGLHLGRHGRVPDRPDADSRRGHAHALHARRSRRDDLRFAQSL